MFTWNAQYPPGLLPKELRGPGNKLEALGYWAASVFIEQSNILKTEWVTHWLMSSG